MNKIIYGKIFELNTILTKNLIDKIKNKKILLDLSGGHDTRVNLSILLKHNIKFEVFTYDLSYGDIKISTKICKKFKLKQHISKASNSSKLLETLSWDIRVGGDGYSEWMCILHKLNKSMNQIKSHNNKYIDKLSNKSMRYSPMLEYDVVEAIKEIPIVYLAGGYIQKKLIGINYPELLKFPFTYYDFRHLLINKFHGYIVDSLYKSYYQGMCNNPYEDKKVKY